MTEACLEKTEANKEKVETKMEVCPEEMEVETTRAVEDRLREQQSAVIYQNPRKRKTRDDFVLVTLEGLKFGKRHQVQPKCNNNMKDRGLKEQLCQ
jgi:hypothetical protein